MSVDPQAALRRNGDPPRLSTVIGFRMRGFGVLIGLLSALTAGFPAAQSVNAATRNRVFGVTTIGGLTLSATYADAINHFGASGVAGARAHFDSAGCMARYPKIGLSLWYLGSEPLANGTPTTCSHFKEAMVADAGWHTRSGLSVGDSTTKLRRLFPHVYDTRHRGPMWSTPSGSIQWDITITSGGGAERPALSAMVTNGHIVALLVEMVGH